MIETYRHSPTVANRLLLFRFHHSFRYNSVCDHPVQDLINRVTGSQTTPICIAKLRYFRDLCLRAVLVARWLQRKTATKPPVETDILHSRTRSVAGLVSATKFRARSWVPEGMQNIIPSKNSAPWFV